MATLTAQETTIQILCHITIEEMEEEVAEVIEGIISKFNIKDTSVEAIVYAFGHALAEALEATIEF